MAPPQKIRVKLSSEAAGAVSLTPVIAQEMELRELVEYALGIVGKEESRIREILLRGTLVSGATRFRWAGWEIEAEDLRRVLATFPDADPARPIAPDRCERAVLRAGPRSLEVTREADGGGLFRRATFWSDLMRLAAPAAYAGYSYRHRADRYVRQLSAAETESLRLAAASLPRGPLREQLCLLQFTALELLVGRGGANPR